MNKIEYIASGTSYLRLNAPRNQQQDDHREFLNSAMASVSQKTNHDFGLLYNAFVETGFGKAFKLFTGYKSIHADSGGLQIVTQGKTVSDAMKQTIYTNQGTYADLSMSFDEIPVGMAGTRSGRNDTANRWFKSEDLEHYARLSGKNIKAQIETFVNLKSNSKPIFIAQGNCYETYMKWVEYGLKEIPQELQQYIGGVAMGAAALGTGTLEDIQRAAYFKFLPIETSHLHILGVGSAKRLLPYLIFMQNGMYDGVTVSYDSTTHTSGVELGLFYNSDFQGINITRVKSKGHTLIYNNIIKEYPEVANISEDTFFSIMNSGYTKYVEEVKGESIDFLKIRTLYILTSIVNFCRHIDSLVQDKQTLMQFADKNKFFNAARLLYNVKSIDDYRHWEKCAAITVKSNKIKSGQPSSLGEFFFA